MPDLSLADLQHGSPVPDYRLSDTRIKFQLSYWKPDDVGEFTEESTLPIREPIGWDAVEWILERDTEWHGFSFEYTGDEIPLTFRDRAVTNYLQAAYAKDGPTAEVRLNWWFEYKDQILPAQTLRLLFDKKDIEGAEDGVTVWKLPAEKVSIAGDIKNKWDTSTSMIARESINGVEIDPPAPVSVILHSQLIKQVTKTIQDTPDQDSPFSFLNGSVDYKKFYLQFPFENPDPNEIASADNESAGFIGSPAGVSTENPITGNRYLIKVRDSGTYNFSIDLDFEYDMTLMKRSISINPPDIENWKLSCWLTIGTLPSVRIGTEKTGRSRSRFLNKVQFTATLKTSVVIPAGSPVYIYGVFEFAPDRKSWKGTDTRLICRRTALTIEAKTFSPSSTARGYPSLDILKHLVAVATGRQNAVQSSYYSRQSEIQPFDGAGSRRIQFNGFAARGFTDRPLQLSLQDQLTSLFAIDGIGMAYKPTDEGDVMVVEPVANWYRSKSILTLTSYTMVKRSVYQKALNSKIEVGYAKFPEEGPQVLDDFSTKYEYSTPLNVGGTYKAVSEVIASGYAIELTRREQFAEKPKDSTKFDDDCFIICAKPLGDADSYTAVGSTSRDSKNIASFYLAGLAPGWLAPGMSIVVSGGNEFNSGTMKITAIQFRAGGSPRQNGVGIPPSTIITVDRNLILEQNITYTITPVNANLMWQADRAEDFERVEGIVDTETAYNLAISPRFNLLRHAPILAGGMIYKDAATRLKLTFAKNNTTLRTKVADAADGFDNIDVKREIQHNDPVNTADLRSPVRPLWRPDQVVIDTELTLDQVLYLRACLQGIHPDPTLHYGCITLAGKPEEGILPIVGYPMSIAYNQKEKKATITLLERYIPLGGDPPDDGCEFYAAYTFGDFENVTPGTLPTWLEECLFMVFN